MKPGLLDHTVTGLQANSFVAVDPSIEARKSAWARFRRGYQWRLTDVGRLSVPIKTPKAKRPEALNRSASEIIQAFRPDVLVLEDQFDDNRVPGRNILTLKESAMAWRFLNVPVIMVEGKDWQRHCFKGYIRQTTLDKKRVIDAIIWNAVLSDRLAAYTDGKITLNGRDEECAFLIGCWFVEAEGARYEE